MSKDQKREFRQTVRDQDPVRAPRAPGHGFDAPVRSKVKGGVHTKADLKRAGAPQGDRIGERAKGLS
ncbi:hypothetical protein [Streptomyces antimicrobicus]|uniref:Uncharacterized protein n=1 Tax=Streptomyces antimicrobicus TaxID=2883108 RepID=A0ABS8B508_9ACTN|nr:hypothetical protein [Streptomyces antimicrobicus]MCB5179710.1 hypothetical protein [Streptomyces antimicrobicus]